MWTRIRASAQAALLLTLAACAPPRSSIGARIARIDAAVDGASVSASRYLRYAVNTGDGDTGDGAWTREVVLWPRGYAERRTRRADGVHYAFGQDARGAWLRVADGGVIEPHDGLWEQEASTGAALFGLAFAHPAADDEATFMGRNRGGWELAYRPARGRTLYLEINPAGRPAGYEVVDDFGRSVACDALDWEASSVGTVLSAWQCRANDRFGVPGVVIEQRYKLEAEETLDGGPPSWARPGDARLGRSTLTRPVEVPITDPRRVLVPVRVGDGPDARMILDTGAFFTILSRRAAEHLPIVPTGEVRLHVDPPWVRPSHLSVGIAEKMTVAGVDLYGERVLIADSDDFGDEIGLLGRSTLRRFVVDVDSPAGVLRLHPQGSFEPGPGDRALSLYGSDPPLIDGAVTNVDRGRIGLDTGMEEDIVVHSPELAHHHRRERGSDRFLGAGDTAHSPDYDTKLDGMDFGPFPFPKMDGIGRDRDRNLVGPGIALVGMGIMRYFRVAFDLRGEVLHVWPGDGYITLRRAGMDVEEVNGPWVDRVIEGGPADVAGVQRGDLIFAVHGAVSAGKSAAAARRAFAEAPPGRFSLVVLRRGVVRTLEIELNRTDDLDDADGDPVTLRTLRRRVR